MLILHRSIILQLLYLALQLCCALMNLERWENLYSLFVNSLSFAELEYWQTGLIVETC